jgi:hypothetical protein
VARRTTAARRDGAWCDVTRRDVTRRDARALAGRPGRGVRIVAARASATDVPRAVSRDVPLRARYAPAPHPTHRGALDGALAGAPRGARRAPSPERRRHADG